VNKDEDGVDSQAYDRRWAVVGSWRTSQEEKVMRRRMPKLPLGGTTKEKEYTWNVLAPSWVIFVKVLVREQCPIKRESKCNRSWWLNGLMKP
jgi:hypothetical protein